MFSVVENSSSRVLRDLVGTYREFRNEPPDAPWDTSATFDAIYEVATARGIPIAF
jgi:hypothetical protein